MAEGFSAVVEAVALALLEAESLDETVPLDILDQKAIEVPGGFADPFPDFAGTLGIEIADDDEQWDRKEDEPCEDRIGDEEHDGNADDGDEGASTQLGSIEEGALDGHDILNDAGGDFAGFTLIVEGDGEAEELLVEVAPHVEEDALFEGIVAEDTQAVKDFAPEVEEDDTSDAIEEGLGRALVFDIGEDPFDGFGDGDDEQGHADGQQLHEAEEPWITEEIL